MTAGSHHGGLERIFWRKWFYLNQGGQSTEDVNEPEGIPPLFVIYFLFYAAIQDRSLL